MSVWSHSDDGDTRVFRNAKDSRSRALVRRKDIASCVAASGVWRIARRPNEADKAVSPRTEQEAIHRPPNLLLRPASQPSDGGLYESLDTGAFDIDKIPVEEACLTTAPNVPPSITRDHPVLLKVPLTTETKTAQLTNQFKYEQWAFNGTVPGPFIRARVGDVVGLTLTNRDDSGSPHNIDSHAFTGPGGGAAMTTAEENETKYHCAAVPVPVHIANGMYGLMYVQPAEGDLPKVDREYCVMQSEVYHEPPEILEDGRPSQTVEFSYPNGLRE
ncbi:hypothetical protein HIM_06714 [Hirsutella minnesotensis 3608]|uniref:Uncharacterized protein n=1 Tax=Hirsutella minnesotensis 3608 TaxID=1043627 RepID=A0A0F7ZIL8_9HYPO|nr:hypothetical protein HIM_06714 [Hirsutella minnesotensis 3608]